MRSDGNHLSTVGPQAIKVAGCIALLWLSNLIAFAQSVSLKFETKLQEQGYGTNWVRCIYQDRQDFIWIGTHNGLSRYDGSEAEVFSKAGARHHYIPQDNIYSVGETRDGQLLVATLNGELLQRDSVTQRFSPYFTPEENQRYGFDRMIFLKIYTDRRNILWLATQGHGLFAFDPRKRTVRSYDTKSSPALLSNQIVTVREDRQQRLWVGTDAGATLLSADRRSSSHYLPVSNQEDTHHINAFFEDRRHRMWAATGRGVFLFQEEKAAFVPLSTQDGQPGPAGIIRALQDDAEGNVWIGTDNGLLIFDLQKGRIRSVITDASRRYALNDKYVFSLCRDRQDNMWVGTYYGGVNVHYASNQGFEQFGQTGLHETLEGKIVRDIVPGQDGALWFGLENRGIVGIPRPGRPVMALNESTRPALLGDQIQGLAVAPDGALWIGSYNLGINYYNPGTGEMRHLTHDPDNPKSLSSNAVNNVLVDRRGRVWVGTNMGGLNRYDPASGGFIKYRFSAGGAKPRGLNSDQIATLYEDRSGKIWVGTTTGLNRYDERQDRFVAYSGLGRATAGQGLYVTAIFEDKRGGLWIGSAGDGLFAIEAGTLKYRHIQPDRQMATATIYKILEDPSGDLWFGSNTGLYRFDPQANTYVKYTTSDGLVSNQFNFNSGSALADGRLVFGTVNGYALFDPEAVHKSLYRPKISITDILANNQPIQKTEDNHETSPREVRLAHDRSTLQFSFVAPEFSSYDSKMYSYRLEGYDQHWTALTRSRTATYTRLPPGAYSFAVRTTNSDGKWVSESLPVLVTISPPWWQTPFAYLFYGLVLLGLIYLLRKYSIIKINRKKQLLLEHFERERAQELSAMKYQFFTSMSHEFRTPLTLILAPLQEVQSRLGQMSQEQLGARFRLMDQQVGRMVRLVDQLMDVSKSESGYLELHPVPADVAALCGQIIRHFDSLARQQRVNLRYVPEPDALWAHIDIDKFEKVLYNLLVNALKYTPPGGAITVRLNRMDSEEAECIVLKVQDTGIGIAAADQARIFERFYQATNQSHTAQKGTGIGLALCDELVKMHGGTISVKSEPNRGSCFTVSLPLLAADGFKQPSTNEHLVREGLVQKPHKVEKVGLNTQLPVLLLVEDNPDIRAYLADLLEETFGVVGHADGQSAWTYLQDHSVDIILSDVMMPGLDGIAFCKLVKENIATCHIPVMMLTARAGVEDQIEGFTTGADDYISKPFHPELLRSRLHNLLAGRRVLKEKFRQELILEPSEITTNSVDERFLREIMAIVECNIENSDFNARSLLESFPMSRSTFYRKLQAITDLSPGDFIRDIRMKRAAQLLGQQQLKVAEIAYAVGYNDLKTFRHNFQQSFGVSPSRFTEKSQTA